MLILVAVACSSPVAAPVALPPAPSNCPVFAPATAATTIADERIDELSGLVASRRNPGVWWAHNDSGDTARIFAIGDDGATVETVDLSSYANAIDWEDIAIGPGPDKLPWLFIADTGDNDHVRGGVRVYFLPEPRVPGDPTREISATQIGDYRYPEGKARNAEALIVDPRDGALYVFTKSDDGDSHVFVDAQPFAFPTGGEVPLRTLEKVMTLTFGTGALPGSPKVTAADVAPDASAVLIRTYDAAYLWPIAEGQSIAKALAGAPCPVPLATEEQGESIAFTADGSGYVTASEGKRQALNRYAGPPLTRPVLVALGEPTPAVVPDCVVDADCALFTPCCQCCPVPPVAMTTAKAKEATDICAVGECNLTGCADIACVVPTDPPTRAACVAGACVGGR